MKTNASTPKGNATSQANQPQKNKNRPENKDNLDSREGEEQIMKGSDITHNKKEKHSEPKKKH
jgi:hypothetical protein